MLWSSLIRCGGDKLPIFKIFEFLNKDKKEIERLTKIAKEFATQFNWEEGAIEEFEVLEGVINK